MLLDEQTGCLLKFSGELEDVSREDFHDVFSGHGKIKWVDFTRGAKEASTKNCPSLVYLDLFKKKKKHGLKYASYWFLLGHAPL